MANKKQKQKKKKKTNKKPNKQKQKTPNERTKNTVSNSVFSHAFIGMFVLEFCFFLLTGFVSSSYSIVLIHLFVFLLGVFSSFCSFARKDETALTIHLSYGIVIT